MHGIGDQANIAEPSDEIKLHSKNLTYISIENEKGRRERV
jgi:hypothetical protein